MAFGQEYYDPTPMNCNSGLVCSTPTRHERVVKARQDEYNERLRGTYLFLTVYTNYSEKLN